MDYGGPTGAREAYPAWSSERQIPLSKEEIEDVFLDLTQKFGFQRDSMRNMVGFLPIDVLWSSFGYAALAHLPAYEDSEYFGLTPC